MVAMSASFIATAPYRASAGPFLVRGRFRSRPSAAGAQQRVPAGALDERADRGAVQPDDQVALPMAGHGPVVGLGGPLAENDVGADVSTGRVGRAGARHPQRSSGTQTRDQLAPQPWM